MNRVLTWTAKRLKISQVHWLSLLLMMSLLVVLIYTLRDITGTRIDPPFFAALLGGLIINLFLVRTRWNNVVVVLINLIISFIFGLELVGHVFSIPAEGGFYTWLYQSNLLLFTWLERVNAWLWYVFQGNLQRDMYGWQLLLVMQTWMGISWLWIGIYRRISIWWVSLPFVILIAFWVQYWGLSEAILIVTLFISFALIANIFFNEQQNYWDTTGLDYSTELWLEWAIAAIMIIILVLGIARTAPLVTTKAGWEKIDGWVDSLRPQKEGGEAGTRPGENIAVEGEPADSEQPSIVLEPPNVNFVGMPISDSGEIVMRVRVSAPVDLHWRSGVYDIYNGRGWQEVQQEPVSTVPEQAPPGFTRFRQEFILANTHNGSLFAAGEPFFILSGDITLNQAGSDVLSISDGGSFLLEGQSRHYQVESWAPLRAAIINIDEAAAVPAVIKQQYGQLPDSIPDRVYGLAERITTGSTSVFEATLRIQQYLRENIPYDLNSPPPPEGRDVVDYFLFEAPSGFCSYYASAMVVLLRSQGIPSRLVSGYAHGEFDPRTGLYTVRANYAHAWVEVYFAGFGWVPFEPTPSQDEPNYLLPENSETDQTAELTPRQWINRRRWLLVGIGTASVGLLGLVGWAGWRLLRRRKRFVRSGLNPFVFIYHQFLFRFHLAGVHVGSGWTPREFLAHNQPLAETHLRLWEGLKTATQLYEKAVYSAMQPDMQDLQILRRYFWLSTFDWLRLWLRYFMKRIQRQK